MKRFGLSASPKLVDRMHFFYLKNIALNMEQKM